MSISLMTAAWKIDLPASPKLVLLAMCDWANDEGASLFPSVGKVAVRASMSERNAKRVLHTLIEAGWLSVVGNSMGGKPGMTRQYQLNAPAILRGYVGATDDKLSPVTNPAERGDSTGKGRVTNGTETGDTGVTLTTIDPPLDPPKAKKRASAPSVVAVDLDFSTWPNPPSTQVLGDWLHLRRQRRAPVTPTVLASFGTELHLAARMGFSVDDCLTKCCNRNWQGFEAAWLARDTPTHHRNAGANHAIAHPGSADHVTQLRQQYEREQGGGGHAGGAEIVDGEFTVVR